MSQASEGIAKQFTNALMVNKIWGGIVINVKTFGAEGDGQTDDTKAIQAAIDAAKAAGKAEVTFPAGTYSYNVLTNTEGIIFVGDGVTLEGITPVNLVSLFQLSNNAINVKVFGAKGDGVTDDTTAIQNAFNYAADNHGVLLIPEGVTFVVDRISVIGKSNFTVLGYGTVKSKNAGQNAPMLSFDGCSNVYIPILNTDGNISGNGGTVLEGRHSLRFQGNAGTPCDTIMIGVLNDKNPSGDTLYINNANNITIDTVRSISDAGTGRNGLSIIKGNNIFVDNLVSLNTGHPTMPGGFDIEPNANTDNVANVKVNYALITTSGTSGIQVANYNMAQVTNIEVNGFVTRNGTTSSNYLLSLNYVVGFRGKVKMRQTGTVEDALLLTNSSNIELYMDSDNSKRGILLTSTVSDFTIKGIITNTSVEGIALNGTFTNGVIDMTVRNVGTSGSGSLVWVGSTSTAQNITFRGNFSKGTTGHSCFRIEGTVSNLRAENLDMSGWADALRVYGANAGGAIFGVNCQNYNYRNALPAAADGYTAGMIIWNTAPTAAGKVGWVVTASGKPGTIKAFGVIDA